MMKSIMQLCYEDFLRGQSGQFKIVRDDGNITVDDSGKWFNSDFELSKMDKECLNQLEDGNILDIACGTGVHLRYLQKLGKSVVGFDISEFSIELAKKMGAKNVYCDSFWNFKSIQKFNNLICMNGSIGFIGKIEKLEMFLKKCQEFLKESGYLYLQGVDWRIDPMKKHQQYIQNNIKNGIYPGVVKFHQEYKNIKEEEFLWVWIDPDTLLKAATNCEFELMRLTYYGAKYFIVLKNSKQ